jgi:hypothetical protein
MLIDYITKEHAEDDQKKGHKFPFIANEILNCDVGKINEMFVTTDHELVMRERRKSFASNPDSDMLLTSDDQLEGFSNNKSLEKEKLEGEESKEKEASEKNEKKDTNTNVNTPSQSNMIEEGAEENNIITKINSITDVHSSETKSQTHLGDSSRNKIELLEYLLNFLDTDAELNYVLAGYFSRFLLLLVNKYPQKVISYVYQERPTIISRLVQHCDKKGISELLPKFLLIEMNCADIIEKAESVRKSALIKLFQQLDVDQPDIEKVSNTSSAIIEVIENKQILEIVISEKLIMEHIFRQFTKKELAKGNDLAYAQNFNFNELINLLITLVKFVQIENLKVPVYLLQEEDVVNSNSSEINNQIDNTPLGELILEFLPDILKHFNYVQESEGDYLEGTFGQTYRPLGTKKYHY